MEDLPSRLTCPQDGCVLCRRRELPVPGAAQKAQEVVVGLWTGSWTSRCSGLLQLVFLPSLERSWFLSSSSPPV